MSNRAAQGDTSMWDCHFHYFDSKRFRLANDCAYQPEDASLEEFQRLSELRGISRAVLVHPSVYGADHTSFEDALAANPDWLRGISVVHPDDKTTTDHQIERWDALGTCGTRINRLFPGSPTNTDRIIDRIKPYGWHVQILTDIVDDALLIRQIAARDVSVVIDHFGHHSPEKLEKSAAFRDLLALMREGCAWVKLSGPYRLQTSEGPWTSLRPIVDALVNANPHRLVWGSDWPHPPNRNYPFPPPIESAVSETILDWLADAELRNLVMSVNPTFLYAAEPRLKP